VPPARPCCLRDGAKFPERKARARVVMYLRSERRANTKTQGTGNPHA